MSLLLGIDYGTTSFKVILFSPTGEAIAVRGGDVTLLPARPGWVEQDERLGWSLVCAAIQGILRETGIASTDIGAIAATGTNNLILFDENGRCLRPAILYGDSRLPSEKDIATIVSVFGEKRIAARFGLAEVSPAQLVIILRSMAASKLLWLKEHETKVFETASYWVTNSWDLINFQLTGRLTYFEEDLAFDREVLSHYGIPESRWGSPAKVGDVVGEVTSKAAAQTGLAIGTPVIMGTRDSLCCFLGSGVVRPGMVVNQGGTTDVVAVSTENRPHSRVGYPVRSILPDLWFVSLSPLRGPTLTWVRNLLLSAEASYADLDRLASTIQPGCEGLICLPYFSGEKSVVHDPDARGVFAGLVPNHSPGHIARSVLEGIAYGIREILENYQADGFPVSEIRLGGGAARSRLWNQIKADVLGRSVSILDVPETGCMGAAILAARAINLYPDLTQASASMVHTALVMEPDPENQSIYQKCYQAYRRLYPAYREVFQLLSSEQTV